MKTAVALALQRVKKNARKRRRRDPKRRKRKSTNLNQTRVLNQTEGERKMLPRWQTCAVL